MMAPSESGGKPASGLALTPMQLAWLQELGLDRRLLAAGLRAAPTPAVAASAKRTASGTVSQAEAPVASGVPQLPAGSPGSEARPVVARTPPPAGSAGRPKAEVAVAPEASAAVAAVPVAAAVEPGSTSWMVIGEVWGEHDDGLGTPYDGRVGLLLQAMLRAAGQDPFGAVYYMSLLKRPGGGSHAPTSEELASCQPGLIRQIAALRPQRLLLLGRSAAQAVLGVDENASFEQWRGTVHAVQLPDGEAIPAVVTYHPAALLASPRHKAQAWRDLRLAAQLPGLSP